MKSYRNTKDYFTYISSSVYWAGAYVLAYLLTTEGRLGCDCSTNCGGGWRT
jgi:hypothetical protein